MAYSNLPNKGSGKLYRLEEAALNTLNTTGTFEEAAIGSVDFSIQEQKSVTMEASRPVPTDVGYHSAHITGTVTLPFRFGRDCTDILSLAMRDTILPSEIAMSPTVSFLAGETHVDGETSPGNVLKVVGANGGFNTLLTASSQSDLRQALLLVTLAATAGNNSATRGPLLVKTGNPRDVAADTMLDLNKRMFQTADVGPSTSWGGAWAASDTADAIGLDAGAYLGLRLSRPSGNDTEQFVLYVGDITVPQYFTVTGVAYGGPTLQFSGRDQLAWSIPFVAAGWSNITVTDPVAGGTLQDTVNTYKRIIRGGSELSKIFLATDSATLALEGTEITNLAWGAPSSPTVVHDTHGTAGPSGYFHVPYTPVFSFDYQLANAAAPRAVTLQTWANAHTPFTAILEFTDSAGNVIYLKADECIPASSIIPQLGGGDGPTRGSFAADIKELTRDDLAWTYHQFSA